MTGLSVPAAIRSVRVATSGGSNGFHQSIIPDQRSLNSERSGPTTMPWMIGQAVPPSVT